MTTPRGPILGVTLMLLGVNVLPARDALAMHLSSTFPALQVVWARYASHFAILLPIHLRRYLLKLLVASWSRLQAARRALFLLTSLFYFLALTRRSVAETLSLFFVPPLVVTLLAPALLREHVTWRELTATLV